MEDHIEFWMDGVILFVETEGVHDKSLFVPEPGDILIFYRWAVAYDESTSAIIEAAICEILPEDTPVAKMMIFAYDPVFERYAGGPYATHSFASISF